MVESPIGRVVGVIGLVVVTSADWLNRPLPTPSVTGWLWWNLRKQSLLRIEPNRLYSPSPAHEIDCSTTADPSKVKKNPDLNLSWQDNLSQDKGFDPPPTPNLGLFAKQIHSESKSLGGRRGNEVYHTWALLLGYANRRRAQGWKSSIIKNDQNIFHFLGLPCGPEKIQYMG